VLVLGMSIKNGKNGLPIGKGLYWKRNKIYAAVYVNGNKLVFCTGTDNVKDAVKFTDEKKADLQRNVAAVATRGIRIQELFDDYILTKKRKEEAAGEYMADKHGKPSYKSQSMINLHLVPVFAELKPEKLTTNLLLKYRDDRMTAGASVVTINNELGCLRAVLRHGTETTPKKVNPLTIPSFKGVIDKKAEKQRARTGLITPTQYESVMDVAPDFMKPIFATVYETGIRSKELKFIRPEQVNFTQHQIELRAGETKNGRPRITALTDNLESILKAWKLKTESEYPNAQWFFHHKGKRFTKWQHQWDRTLKLAGLRVKQEDGTWKNLVMFHDTRRTAITRMDAAGIPQADRMKNSGHTHEPMDARYNQNEQRAKERVRKSMNDFNAGKTPKTALSVPVAPVVANEVVAGNGWVAELKELKSLMDDGILTAEEFASEKARVMAAR
jgi:integrase